jgi:hypothetical protein
MPIKARKRRKPAIVFVSGGVVQGVQCPKGVSVEIRDYDDGKDVDLENPPKGYTKDDFGEDEDGVYQIARHGGGKA